MKDVFIIVFSVFIIFQVTVATELTVTRSMRCNTTIPRDGHLTEFEGGSFYNLDLELYYKKDYIRIDLTNNLFSDSSRSYRCTHWYNQSVSQTLAIGKFHANEAILAVGNHDHPHKTIPFEVMKFDLATCNVTKMSSMILADRLYIVGCALTSICDIVIENSPVCGKKLCKMTLDSQLNVVAGPEELYESFGDSIALYEVKSTTRRDKIYLLMQLNYSEYTYRFTLLPEESSRHRLLLDLSNPNTGVPLTEFEHDVVSIFYDTKMRSEGNVDGLENDNTTLKLFRFNLDGDLILQKDFNYTKWLPWYEVRNLKDGGFMLFIGEFVDSDFIYYVTKFDGNGKVSSETLKIREFVAPHNSVSKAFRIHAKDGKFCLFQVQETQDKSRDSNKNCILILEKCFREEELD